MIIYSQVYKYKGGEFQVWSYLSSSDPQSSSLLFAFQSGGETVEGLPNREDAIRQARERIVELSPEPVETTPAADQPPQPEVAPLREEAPARSAQISLFAP